LSTPAGFIDYKIMLCNPDFICPSEDELKRGKKATYQFVIVRDGEDIKSSIDSLTMSSKAYILFGELKDSVKKLALIVELCTNKTISSTDRDAVWINVDKLIKDNPSKFVEVAGDEYLDTKLLISESVNTGLIRKRGNYYYLADTNQPLCGVKQEPTLQSACEFLNSSKNQEIKFSLEAKIK